MSGIIASFADKHAGKLRQQATTNSLWDEANEMRLALIAKVQSGGDISMVEICACADAWRLWHQSFNSEGA